MSESAFVYLSLADNTMIVDLMRQVQSQLSGDGIEWQPVPTLHITLLYAPVVDDYLLIDIARSIHVRETLWFELGELGIFENGNERALHIKVDPSDYLRSLQRRIYEEFIERGIEVSPYSNPQDWQAHITLAYLPADLVVPDDLELATGWDTGANKVVIGRDDYQPLAEIMPPTIKSVSKAWVLKQEGIPERLMLIITSNAYRDREQEIVSEKALTDYVESSWQGDTFVGDNTHLLWHDGDPIGDIIYADMEGPFLIEVSRERANTMINIARQGEEPLYTTVKAVWDALESAPDLAASHRFFYDEQDREDRIYDMILKTETSTLPRWAAANLVTLSEVVHGR